MRRDGRDGAEPRRGGGRGRGIVQVRQPRLTPLPATSSALWNLRSRRPVYVRVMRRGRNTLVDGEHGRVNELGLVFITGKCCQCAARAACRQQLRPVEWGTRVCAGSRQEADAVCMREATWEHVELHRDLQSLHTSSEACVFCWHREGALRRGCSEPTA
jgi:hypothetical protein